MKKDLIKKITAIALVATATLLMPAGLFATQADTAVDKSITGNNTVVNPVYKVSLPTSLAFAVDAFNLKEKGSVSSNDFAVVNRSNVPVLVTANFKTTAKSDVTLVDAANGVTDNPGTKQAFIQLALANGPKADDSDPKTAENIINNTVTTPVWAYKAAVEILSASADATNGVDLHFLLDKALYNDAGTALATDAVDVAKNAAGFKITGDVTEYPQDANGAKPWLGSDVTVVGKFTILGLTTTNWTAYKANSTPHTASDAINIFSEVTTEEE